MTKLLWLLAAAGGIATAVVIARRRRRLHAFDHPQIEPDADLDLDLDIVDAEIIIVQTDDFAPARK